MVIASEYAVQPLFIIGKPLKLNKKAVNNSIIHSTLCVNVFLKCVPETAKNALLF